MARRKKYRRVNHVVRFEDGGGVVGTFVDLTEADTFAKDLANKHADSDIIITRKVEEEIDRIRAKKK